MPDRIDEILNPKPVEAAPDDLREFYRNRRVLITGAGGSIGSEICRQLALCQVGDLVLLGHGENSLVELHKELEAKHPRLQVWLVVGDIRDGLRMFGVMDTYKPGVVIHAAAHKHVPLMERNPLEAVSNNICGTAQLVGAAAGVGIERFVLISTDKAVEPVSWMGATKRVGELLTIGAGQEREAGQEFERAYCAIRFGNVAWSRGSVLPVFEQQIAMGGPVTITDARAERFFLTLPEAGTLVLRAASFCEGPQIFALEMGEPIKIIDLATRMIGNQKGIDIMFTGLQPGERLREKMWIEPDQVTPTPDGRIWEESIFKIGSLTHVLTESQEALAQMDVDKMAVLIGNIVPSFRTGKRHYRFGRLS